MTRRKSNDIQPSLSRGNTSHLFKRAKTAPITRNIPQPLRLREAKIALLTARPSLVIAEAHRQRPLPPPHPIRHPPLLPLALCLPLPPPLLQFPLPILIQVPLPPADALLQLPPLPLPLPSLLPVLRLHSLAKRLSEPEQVPGLLDLPVEDLSVGAGLHG